MTAPNTLDSIPQDISLDDMVDESEPRTTISTSVRIANLITVILPFLGLIAGVIYMWGWGFNWLHLGIFLGMYSLTGLGITVGFHRLFTHRAFEAVKPVRFILAVLGSMAVQGPVLRWVATHRRHHQHSDREDDPHSPHKYGDGLLAILRGLWHSHMGWLFKPDAPNLDRYVCDLEQDGLIRKTSNLFTVWVALGLIIPTVLGGVLTQSWTGALLGFIWGGLVRVFLVHHVTWSINSICHLWGSKPFRSKDESRNNFLFGVLGWGEGWHNNHHAFPTSARHGLRWWEFDFSYIVIRMLAVLGLAWDLRLPSRESMESRLSGAC